MKQKDLATILVAVVISAIFSFLISRAVFNPSKTHNKQAATVAPLSSDFPTPDSKYFNSNSIDPTQNINIGNNSNTEPFKVPNS